MNTVCMSKVLVLGPATHLGSQGLGMIGSHWNLAAKTGERYCLDACLF